MFPSPPAAPAGGSGPGPARPLVPAEAAEASWFPAAVWEKCVAVSPGTAAPHHFLFHFISALQTSSLHFAAAAAEPGASTRTVATALRWTGPWYQACWFWPWRCPPQVGLTFRSFSEPSRYRQESGSDHVQAGLPLCDNKTAETFRFRVEQNRSTEDGPEPGPVPVPGPIPEPVPGQERKHRNLISSFTVSGSEKHVERFSKNVKKLNVDSEIFMISFFFYLRIKFF